MWFCILYVCDIFRLLGEMGEKFIGMLIMCFGMRVVLFRYLYN